MTKEWMAQRIRALQERIHAREQRAAEIAKVFPFSPATIAAVLDLARDDEEKAKLALNLALATNIHPLAAGSCLPP